MPDPTSLAAHLRARPDTWATVARAVADEDSSSLTRALWALGFPVTASDVDRLLDQPGPFGPALLACT